MRIAAEIKDWLRVIHKVLIETKYFCIGLVRSFEHFGVRVRTVVKEHFCEKKFGIITTGCSLFNDIISLHRDGVAYQPTPYGILEKTMNYLRPGPEDVFVDLGCGKGKAVFFAAEQNFKKVIGVELRKELADIALQNLKSLKIKHAPVEIINTDVSLFDLKDGTIFFMFNPFGQDTLMKVVDNIKASLLASPRRIRIVYYGGGHQGLLDKEEWLEYQGAAVENTVRVWSNKDNTIKITP